MTIVNTIHYTGEPTGRRAAEVILARPSFQSLTVTPATARERVDTRQGQTVTPAHRIAAARINRSGAAVTRTAAIQRDASGNIIQRSYAKPAQRVQSGGISQPNGVTRTRKHFNISSIAQKLLGR